MAAYPQWICWQLIHRADKPKPDKVPTDPNTRLPINPHDPSVWMDGATALRTAQEKELGLGFVFTALDPFFFLDVDECVTPQGEWSLTATLLASLLQGAAVETSVSGRGLHVFGRCPGALPPHSNKNKEHHIELYSTDRFVAIGHGAIGDAGFDCSDAITKIAQHYFPPPPDLSGIWTDEPEPGAGIPDDEALIRKALASRSVASTFDDKASFRDLWEANDLVLAGTYPDPVRAYDESSADMALASHLAFWTGGNCEQILRLMRQSGLARDKWEARDGWLVNTILKAVAGSTTVYRGTVEPTPDAPPTMPVPETVPPAPLPAANDGPASYLNLEIEPMGNYPYCAPENVLEKFRDCIYVISENRIMMPDGELLDKARFQSVFGKWDFALDYSGAHTKDPWRAFIQSRCWSFLHANRLCFRPNNPNRTIYEHGFVLANTWRDPKPRRVKGDPSPFIKHVRRLLPNGDDAEYLIAYLAACVQHQGTKFMWCPLVQGVQGNGKSMLGKIVGEAIGEQYVYTMTGEDLHGRFNGWIAKNTFVMVEDFFMGGRRDMNQEAAMERLKPMITCDRIQVERKGFDQSTEKVCANFLLTTNRQDAIPIDPNERRWAVFFCAQQREADKVRDGLTEAYFNRFFHWLEHEDGFAICADYLWSLSIPAHMDPTVGCHTAPKTTSHAAAIEASRGIETQLIQDAIADERAGFRDGWLSSTAVRAMLLENQIRTSPQKISSILSKLNFFHHPGLDHGKPARKIPMENSRSRLWVREGHSSWHLRGEDAVAAYERAQGYLKASVVPIR